MAKTLITLFFSCLATSIAVAKEELRLENLVNSGISDQMFSESKKPSNNKEIKFEYDKKNRTHVFTENTDKKCIYELTSYKEIPNELPITIGKGANWRVVSVAKLPPKDYAVKFLLMRFNKTVAEVIMKCEKNLSASEFNKELSPFGFNREFIFSLPNPNKTPREQRVEKPDPNRGVASEGKGH